MSGPRIVIVTYNWPPRNAIGTHRPYSWARYWSEAGARVTVLTARKQAFDEPLDMPLPALDRVEVIEVPYGGARGGVANKVLKSQSARRLAKRVNAWLSRKTGAGIDPRGAWRMAAVAEASRLAKEADIVVSTFGPAAAHLIACDMKSANPDLRWVADYRDLWSQRHTGDISEATRREMREVELASVGAHAGLLTTVSEDAARQLRELTGKTVLTFRNGFDLDEAEVRQRLMTPAQKPGGPLRIVYTGMIYQGFQDPTPLLDALAQSFAAGELERGSVTVDFYGARVEAAQELARNPEYAPFIRLMGHVPRETALEAQRGAGLLLLLESSKPEARGTLTGKLFEYIAAGRPILCIGSRPEYEIGQLLSATGTGAVFGPEDHAGIREAVLTTMKGAGLYDSYRPDCQEILRYSRKRIAADFWDALQYKFAQS